MTAETFLAELEALVAEHRRTQPSIQCIQSTGGIACADCVFCTDCERCISARYSNGCKESFDITHCDQCSHCYSCTFCQHSEHCAYSNYLVHCLACIRCDYCFGCVGLEKKAFHILNLEYSRKEYFQTVKQLEPLLGPSLVMAGSPG